MLVLSRKEGEAVYIGNDIKVVITRVSGNKVRIGIETAEDIPVLRGELIESGTTLGAPLPQNDYQSLAVVH